MGNYHEDTKEMARKTILERLGLTTEKEDWKIIDGRETTLTAIRLKGDFLPSLLTSDTTKDAQPQKLAKWVPLVTALKIMQMPKVVGPFHADRRILETCKLWFPKQAQRAVGITPSQRAEELAKAREVIAAESKDLKWLQ